jgi:hypothetical protein
LGHATARGKRATEEDRERVLASVVLERVRAKLVARAQARRAAIASARAALVIAALVAAVVAGAGLALVRMPGSSYDGAFADPSDEERALEGALRADVRTLAVTIGERSHANPEGLARAADAIEAAFGGAGLAVARQRYEVAGRPADNVEATLPGRGPASDEIVVVGAHYDVVAGTTGADDNASGVAAMLAIARAVRRDGGLATSPARRTVRFVAFASEEPPHFHTDAMGSVVYARRCRARGDRVVAMLSLETLGFYTDRPASQRYPFPFGLLYPTTGDFVGFVGNPASRALVREAVGTFRASARFPSEGVAAPGLLPGVGWSDHWAFWQEGFPAIMVTDTAPFRNPAYHTTGDTADRLSYPAMARVVVGLVAVVEHLATR